MMLCAILCSAQHRKCATNPIWHSMKTIPHDKSGIWYVDCSINECANMFFGALVVGCRHFDWLDSLREHIAVDDIIRV